MVARSDAAAAAASGAPAPTWRELEEREAWSARQEKQFREGLRAYGGVANGKEKWRLIAERVDGKDRAACYNHHKLA